MQLDRGPGRELHLPNQSIPERFAGGERRHVERRRRPSRHFERSRVVQRQDVGMAEIGDDPDLPGEPLRADRLGQLRPKHLEREWTLPHPEG